MTQWIWFNGDIRPMSEVCISVEDRGFQFADGVYEVIRLYNGRPFALREHLNRLERSAGGVQISLPLDRDTLAREIHKLIDVSKVREGMVYLQLTRGASQRNHVFPTCQPTLLFYARPLSPPNLPGEGEGIKLLEVPDDRWTRCWIKSIALLPNVLAKNAAIAAGADEAVFVENGIASECCASNLFAVLGGKVVTHPVGSRVLPGITRLILLELAVQLGIEADERPLRVEEALRADELFIASTTREVNWVAKWNDRYIGQGRCGPVTIRLHRAYCQRVLSETA